MQVCVRCLVGCEVRSVIQLGAPEAKTVPTGGSGIISKTQHRDPRTHCSGAKQHL